MGSKRERERERENPGFREEKFELVGMSMTMTKGKARVLTVQNRFVRCIDVLVRERMMLVDKMLVRRIEYNVLP